MKVFSLLIQSAILQMTIEKCERLPRGGNKQLLSARDEEGGRVEKERGILLFQGESFKTAF